MFIKLLLAVFLVSFANDSSARPKKNNVVKVKQKVKPKKSEKVKDEQNNILQPYGIVVNSTHALLIDSETNQVLLDKNGDEQLEPASMTKIMTAYMVMKALHDGRVKPESLVTISRNARQMEGSDMFLEVGDQVTVDNLIKGLIVVSGNDAAIALSEFLGGTQDAFAADMTAVAKKMGCSKTEFKNASGLPQEGHLSTARDLIIMSKRTLEDFPKWYGVYKETSFTYRGITQPNRNVLLNKNIGCDGVKTGHAECPGYSMVASAVQNGRRLFLVVAGLRSMKQRADEATRLLNWGFANFGNYTIYPPNKPIIELLLRYGVAAKIAVEAAPHQLTIQHNRVDQTKAVIFYEDVLEAPLKAGTKVGEAVVTHPDWSNSVVIPLVFSKDVERSSFLLRIGQSLQYIFQKG
jgi:D-alanyl-D-alanine carboxypeptidase (penicillin-binding protein 5/6)